MLFTLTAVLLQPVSGGVLMMLSSTASSERWLMTSLGLYAVAGLFWVPVIFMQIEMRDLARGAAAQSQPLPPRYFALFRRWFLFGIPGFGSVMAILWLMIAKPLLEARMSEADASRKILVLGASGLIGRFVTDDLRARGFQVVGVARQLFAVAEGKARSISNCRSCRWMRRRWRGCSREHEHRCRRQLPRRAAGRPRQRHRRRASRFRRAAAAGDRRQRPARSAWSISRSPAPPTRTAPPSARPSARPSG